MTGARVDRNVVERRLTHLLASVDILKEYQALSPEELAAGPKVYWAVQHGLQLCVQAVLDIATHLVAALGGPIGEDYRSQIMALADLGVLPRAFAERIAPMAGFRNVLVHEYMDVDLREVHRFLTHHLGDFEAFAYYIHRYLSAADPSSDAPR